MKTFNSTFQHHPRHEHSHHHHHHHHHHHSSSPSQANWTTLMSMGQNMTTSARSGFINDSWLSGTTEPFTSSPAVSAVTEGVLRFLSTRAVIDDESYMEGINSNNGSSFMRDLITTTPFGTDVTTSGLNTSAAAQVSSSFEEYVKKMWYPILVPLMLLFCALSSIINLLIVFSVRWCRKPMTPTLYFSISLALADAFGSIVIGLGLIVNSLLPIVYGIFFENNCFQLTIEAFRLGGVVVAATHLMALAINHWIGIVRPLQYEATMTRGTAFRVIVISWVSPILILLLYFSSVQGQGFQSPNCRNCDFMQKLTFRVIFASFFFAPLAIMIFIYWHIFIIVRSHIHYRKQYSCQQLRRNVKAVVTTVLILGTYIVGWMPAILWFILVCNNCVYSLDDVSLQIRIPVNMVINTLIIMKAVVDPIIYAARMADIQIALRKMRYDFFLWIFESCAPPRPAPLDTLEMGSVRFTKSFRMSSRGSSSRSNV